MSIVHQRRQWAVGHGGFHTAELAGNDGSRFRYIYDCGSWDSHLIKKSVREYLDSLGSDRHIDAVVISHLDSDHVSGIPELLAQADVTVGAFFIPLLTPVERLLAVASGSHVGAFETQLALDPVVAIQALAGGARVFQIESSGDPSQADGDTVETIGDNPFAQIIGPTSTRAFGAAGERLPDSASIVAGSAGTRHWILRFFAKPPGARQMARFEAGVAPLLGTVVEDLRTDPESKLTLRRIRFLLEHHLDALRDVSGTSRTRNSTSLMLLSAPVQDDTPESADYMSYSAQWHGAAWLLTGDARLRSRRSHQTLHRHFGPQVESLAVLALPHHGSALDFNGGLLELGNRPLGLAFASVNGRDPHHPGAEVTQALAEAHVALHLVTRDAATTLRARWER